VQAELQFSPKINCFIGNNGMGKTNLLDAVYYLSFCKSYTNPIDSQIIRHDADVCMLQGKYLFEDSTREEIFSATPRAEEAVQAQQEGIRTAFRSYRIASARDDLSGR